VRRRPAARGRRLRNREHHEAYDIWEVADANAVGAALTSAAQDPSFLALVPEFETVFESETLSIVTKAPFRPLTRLRTTC
jgi:hypothetical protein